MKIISISELSKIRPDLARLWDKNNKIAEATMREFAKKKGMRDISLSKLMSKGGGKLVLELNRFIDVYAANLRNKQIPDEITFGRKDADGVPVEWIRAPDSSRENVLFYLFGGGYAIGTLDTRRWSPYLLVRDTGLSCLNVEYRLAPEHPFPAALEDSITAYRWLLKEGISPNKIVIGGESAGGGLTMSTLLKIRDLSLPLPAAAIMLSPWMDLTCKSKSIKSNAKYEPILASVIQGLAILYTKGKNRKDPFISPLYANLEGLPPMLIHVGSLEILHDECTLFAERAESAGIDVTFKVWDDMIHGFHVFGDDLPDSIEAFNHIKQFIQKHVSS